MFNSNRSRPHTEQNQKVGKSKIPGEPFFKAHQPYPIRFEPSIDNIEQLILNKQKNLENHYEVYSIKLTDSFLNSLTSGLKNGNGATLLVEEGEQFASLPGSISQAKIVFPTDLKDENLNNEFEIETFGMKSDDFYDMETLTDANIRQNNVIGIKLNKDLNSFTSFGLINRKLVIKGDKAAYVNTKTKMETIEKAKEKSKAKIINTTVTKKPDLISIINQKKSGKLVKPTTKPAPITIPTIKTINDQRLLKKACISYGNNVINNNEILDNDTRKSTKLNTIERLLQNKLIPDSDKSIKDNQSIKEYLDELVANNEETKTTDIYQEDNNNKIIENLTKNNKENDNFGACTLIENVDNISKKISNRNDHLDNLNKNKAHPPSPVISKKDMFKRLTYPPEFEFALREYNLKDHIIYSLAASPKNFDDLFAQICLDRNKYTGVNYFKMILNKVSDDEQGCFYLKSNIFLRRDEIMNYPFYDNSKKISALQNFGLYDPLEDSALKKNKSLTLVDMKSTDTKNDADSSSQSIINNIDDNSNCALPFKDSDVSRLNNTINYSDLDIEKIHKTIKTKYDSENDTSIDDSNNLKNDDHISNNICKKNVIKINEESYGYINNDNRDIQNNYINKKRIDGVSKDFNCEFDYESQDNDDPSFLDIHNASFYTTSKREKTNSESIFPNKKNKSELFTKNNVDINYKIKQNIINEKQLHYKEPMDNDISLFSKLPNDEDESMCPLNFNKNDKLFIDDHIINSNILNFTKSDSRIEDFDIFDIDNLEPYYDNQQNK